MSDQDQDEYCGMASSAIEIINSKKYYEDNQELKQAKEKIFKAYMDNKVTPSRAKLQLWLYRTLRIVMTDGRVLIGVFLCTDADANVIFGVCSEYAPYGGEERMLGLVMVQAGSLSPWKSTVGAWARIHSPTSKAQSENILK